MQNITPDKVAERMSSALERFVGLVVRCGVQ